MAVMHGQHSNALYRVVGMRHDGTRDVRYERLSRETAEQVRKAMLTMRDYVEVIIEEQPRRNPAG
jgi:hypothetical protein